MQTNRKSDHKGEQEVHKFLMKYFYSGFHQFREPLGKQEQLDGIDMHLCVNNCWFTVDEKCQLTRLNNQINDKTTQAIEILSKTRNGSFRQGWIYNTKTDYYLFTYITNCRVNNQDDLTCDDILNMRAVLISKSKVIDMIINHGITLRNLSFFANRMVFHNYYNDDKEYNGKHMYYTRFGNLTDKIWLCYTKSGLYETPVNCVIRWSLYEEYAWHVYDITPNGVRIIK